MKLRSNSDQMVLRTRPSEEKSTNATPSSSKKTQKKTPRIKPTANLDLNEESSDPTIRCKFCDFLGRTNSAYREHLVLHCQDLVSETGVIESSHTVKLANLCCACEMSFTRPEKLKAHLLEYHRLRLTSGKHHERMDATHYEEFDVISPTLDDPSLCCNVCSYMFPDKDSFKRHLMIHHKYTFSATDKDAIARPKMSLEEALRRAAAKKALAKRTGKKKEANTSIRISKYGIYTQPQNLSDSSLSGEEDESEEEVYPHKGDPCCRICSKDYTAVENCIRHVQDTHCSQRLISKLPEKFTKNNHLQNIYKIPGVDVNSCTFCMQVFPDTITYRAHLTLVHNASVWPDIQDENSYCRNCNRAYKSQASYLHHCRKIHRVTMRPILTALSYKGMDPLICRLCQLDFYTPQDLQYHKCATTVEEPKPDASNVHQVEQQFIQLVSLQPTEQAVQEEQAVQTEGAVQPEQSTQPLEAPQPTIIDLS